jgi:hypothetical protein
MRVGACLAAALTLVAAGCGGEGANDVLAKTAGNLGKIRSGDLTLGLKIATRDGKEAGFQLQGPFALARAPGALPVAKITFTRLGSQAPEPVTIISTGRKAYVRVGGTTYELPESRLGSLRSTKGTGSRGLGSLDIGTWVEDPKLSDGGTVGGADTDRVHADLDVVQATNGLLALASSLGAGVGGPITGRDADDLRRAVKSATLDVYTGKDDRLLRRLRIRADLRANAPPKVLSALGAFGELDVRFDLDVAHPNQPVHVEAPANVEPLPTG